MNEDFAKFARFIAVQCGHSYAFVASVVLVVAWLVTGPWFDWSDTWQLIANTVTTLVTFCMVFIIQNSQNRDTLAMQMKLDELIAATDKASNRMQQIEDKNEAELLRLRESRDSANAVHCEDVQVAPQQEVAASQSEEGSEDRQRDAKARRIGGNRNRNRKRQS
jgi:low affinity Fe/Cu permease